MSHIAWGDYFSVRLKLLLVSCFCVTTVASAGGYAMLRSARTTLELQIDEEQQLAGDLMVSLVKRTIEANIHSFLRGIAEKNVEILGALQREVDAGRITLDEAKMRGRATLLAQRIGETGYIYAVDRGGVLRVHPKDELVGVDVSKYEFVQRQKAEREGYLEYDWANPGETVKRPKALSMAYFAPWDWIVSVSSYREEFVSLLNVGDLSASILATRFGDTGYAYVLDEKG